MSLLQQRDWQIIGAGLLLSLVGGVVGHLGLVSVQQEIMVGYAAVIPIIPGLAFIWLARDQWGGQVARYLELIGAGFAVHLVVWVPHIRWHVLAEADPNHVPPAWLGFDPSFWYVFFHGISLFAFALITYGFYLFWQEGSSA